MNRRRIIFVHLAAAAALLAFAMSGAAHAQGAASNKQAEALFREGRKLMEARDYASACPKLAESQRIEPAAGTLLNLADCYEKNGQLPLAWNTFKEAGRAATARGRAEWVTTATERAAVIEPKIALLTVNVGPSAASIPGLHVERDNIILERETWGTMVAVEPGQHLLLATAPNKKKWTLRLDLAAGRKEISEVPALNPEVEERLAPVPVVKESPATRGEPDGKTTRILGYVLAGAGGVALGVGTFTGISALSLRSDAAGRCESYPDRCDPDATSANDEAKTMATVSTISLVAGVVLVAFGVVLVVTSPSRRPDRTTLSAPPSTGRDFGIHF